LFASIELIFKKKVNIKNILKPFLIYKDIYIVSLCFKLIFLEVFMKKIFLLLSFIGLMLFLTACPPDEDTVKPPATSSIIESVLIPAGTFQMGNTGAYSGESDEKPVHSVTISRAFRMSKYEVTQSQWKTVMNTDPSDFKGNNLPVESVSWYGAVDFCNKLSDRDGLTRCYTINGTDVTCSWSANGWRLPTEAEWEYACKAGTTTDFYSGSLTNVYCSPLDENLDKIGWYCGNENTKTRDVGQKEPNAFGLYDMSGNVWEWCWDWYSSYSNTSVTDPTGASTGSRRVLRGGSWSNGAGSCRSSSRYGTYYLQFNSCSLYGFRISRTN
jgi:formylglycine-generating enzyme required for sulfatase activity